MDIRIDRIRLQASGMSPDAARRLGRLLAEHLAATMAAAPRGSDPAAEMAAAVQLPSLRVRVPQRAGQHPGSLAPVTATEISRALRAAITGSATTSTGAASTGAGTAR